MNHYSSPKNINYDELNNSPMFNLSMASKELFHSNMLYWISNKYRSSFKNILNNLEINTDEWGDTWKSYREKYNYDFSIIDKDNNLLLIIENKVKSVPDTNQLDKYSEEIKCVKKTIKILLSLTTQYPNKEIVNDWVIINYEELAFAIMNSINSYHYMLLCDYCYTIQTLSRIQSSWTINDKDLYYDKYVKEVKEDKFRIGDLRKKILCSHLALKIQENLKGEIKTNKEIKKIVKDNKDNTGDCYINWGMTRSMGIVDVKVRIKKNLIIGVQLQGDSYKHYIETLDTTTDNIVFLESVRSLIYPQEGHTTNNRDSILQSIFSKDFLYCGQNTTDGYPFHKKLIEAPKYKRKTGDKDIKGYNKYGSTFIYQYVKIAKEAKISDIINAVSEDVNKIKEIIKK